MVASRFDMSAFIEQEHSAKAANVANPATSAASAGLAGCDIERGISKLAAMPSPHPLLLADWPRIVADAVWLQETGKAKQAIAAGWSVPEVFGWSGTSWRSIATWLNGSRVLVVGGSYDGPLHTKWACKRNGEKRLFFIRNMGAKPPDDILMLWDLAKT